MFSLPVVVSITLLVSWVLALTVTALMAYWLVPSSADSGDVLMVRVARRLGRLFGRGAASGPSLTVSQQYERIDPQDGMRHLHEGLRVWFVRSGFVVKKVALFRENKYA